MASIQKVGSKYRVQVARKGIRKSAMWDTRREATEWGLRVEREIDAGLLHGRSLKEAIDHYVTTVSTTKADPEWERRRLNAFMSHFSEDTGLADIGSAELGKWRDKRLKTVSGSTVLREVNLIRNMFIIAKDEWKWIDTNPFTGVRLPDENDPRTQVWPWQLIKRVLRADRDRKTGEVIKAFHIALHTGLRLAEVLTGKYDAARRVFILNRSKGDGTKRVEVPVPRRAARLLPAKFTVGANEASALFCTLCDQLLIEDLHFHDSRATALTLLSRRMDVMTLARISRHKDINILLNTYYRESATSISARI